MTGGLPRGGLALPLPAAPADRPEPRTTTLADLAALVVGFALAFAAGRGSLISTPAGLPPLPLWARAMHWAGAAAQASCLALAAVAVARRVRHGRPMRPAEFLALVCALPMLNTAVESLPGVSIGVEAATPPNPPVVHNEGYRCWKLILTCAFVAAALAFARYRRRLPAWAAMGLLGLALLGFSFGVSDLLGRGYSAAIRGLGLNAASSNLNIMAAFLVELPAALPFGIAGAAALLDRRGRRGRGWAWGEWAALALALYLVAWFVGSSLVELAATSPRAEVVAVVVFLALWLALSLLAAWRLGPAWRRWTAPAYNG